MQSVNAYNDVGIYVEFFSDTKIQEIANDKIIISDELIFPKEIVVAARSLDEFYLYENKIREKIDKNIIVRYWPILNKEEGYWISFDSDTKALERIFNEIKERENNDKLYVMIDFENPIQKVGGYNFDENKRLIYDLIENKDIYNLNISIVQNTKVSVLGMKKKDYFSNYDIENVKMFYSSFHTRYFLGNLFSKYLLKKEIKRGLKYDGNYVIALGCLDIGIQGNEPLITKDRLRYDLSIAKKNNLRKVMLFGYSMEYKEVIKDYVFS
ncbi:MAG: hypothetical protein V1663_00090 [archaeon]